MVLPSVTRASRPTKSVNAASAPSAMRMVVSAVSSSSMMISTYLAIKKVLRSGKSAVRKEFYAKGLCIFEQGGVHNLDVNQCRLGKGLKSHSVRGAL